METEIERKFLIKNSDWKNNVSSSREIRQGYLNLVPERNVRVRISGSSAVLTIKGITIGITRKEFEYEIPYSEGLDLLELCEGSIIEKTRHIFQMESHTWEIDEFRGDNEGLIVAEIELSNEDEVFAIPDWLGDEVSHDPRYYNSALVTHPFKDWN